MNRPTYRNFAVTCLVAAGTGLLGFAVATSNAADDAKRQQQHAYDAAMKQHVQMMKGAEGAAMMRQHMLMMAAHQHLLGEMANDPDLKRAAQDPQMAKALQEVKAALKDHAATDAKKGEVAKNQKEAMMVLAHALMKQDKELAQMLRAAEEGQAHETHK